MTHVPQTKQKTPTNTAFITQKTNLTRYELTRTNERLNPRLTFTPHPKRFDIIGDVAVISIPPELDNSKDVIAKTIVSKRGNVRTVLNKVAKLDGEKRVGGFERLLGSDTVTLHREFGFGYWLDL